MTEMKKDRASGLFLLWQTVLWTTRSSAARNTKSAADFDKRYSRIVIPTEAEESSSFALPLWLVRKQKNGTPL